MGETTSGGVVLAYNWISGELSLLPNTSLSSKFGTPDGASVSLDVKLFVANGATENKSLTEPSDITNGQLTVDVWGKAGVAYEEGYAVERELGAAEYPGGPKQLLPITDPNSQRLVKFWTIDPTLGLNLIANTVDFNWGRSPAPNFNTTGNIIIFDFNKDR